MPTTSLRELVGRGRRDDDVILVCEHGTWSGSDLRALVQVEPIVQAASFGSVALRFADPARMALALMALDGKVQRLLLLSADMTDEIAATLSRTFGADVLFTDLQTSAPGAFATRTIEWTEALAPGDAGPLVAAPPVDTIWTLTTSGTTGTPKLVATDLPALSRSTKAASTLRYRWGQLFNIERFAGVQVFLQGMIGGILVLPRTDWSLAQRLDFLAEHAVTAISATPTLWRKILMTPASARLQPLQVTLGGEIVDDAILQALSDRFPSARLVHIYASTEAGVAFSVKDKKAGFPLEYLTETPGGVRLKVVDGRLFVHNGGSETASGLQSSITTADGYVDTGDTIAIVGDRCYFRGRANGTINVGGNKLFPEEVEQVLLDHPEVHLARVGAKSSPITGQLVVAEIVPSGEVEDTALLRMRIQQHCASRLERWKVPALIRIVSQLETSASGKIKRHAT